MLAAGQLNRQIELLGCEVVTDTTGQQTTTWRVKAKTLAYVMQAKGSRAISASEVWNPGQIVLMIRWRPGVTFRDRVRLIDTGEVYAISNVAPDRKQGSITINATSIDYLNGSDGE